MRRKTLTEVLEAGEREVVAQLTVVRIHLALHPQIEREEESQERMGNPITTPVRREKYLSGRERIL
jgi:hypothetical protein